MAPFSGARARHYWAAVCCALTSSAPSRFAAAAAAPAQEAVAAAAAAPAPPMELETFLDLASGYLGLLGLIVTITVSLNQLWSIHLARARKRDEKLDADAAAAVAAVNASYVAPLRREKMGTLLAGQGAHAPPGPGGCDPPYLAQLYTSWALTLKLSPREADDAFEQAVGMLAEDYPSLDEGVLRARVHKALSLAKAGMPGTLHNISTFISRVSPCALSRA